MRAVQLKLKQASAVLGTATKELQNLVQFGVVRPKRRAGIFLFDTNTLCTALFALYLKRVIGAKTEILSLYSATLSANMDDFLKRRPDFVVFTSRVPTETVPVQLKVPFRRLTEDLQQRLEQLPLFKDLPRGRKRRGWKKEFLATLRQAARDLGDVSAEEVIGAVRDYRREKRQRPEITVHAEA